MRSSRGGTHGIPMISWLVVRIVFEIDEPGHCGALEQNNLLSQCFSPPRSINGYLQIVGEA